jgi:hypothetical protein
MSVSVFRGNLDDEAGALFGRPFQDGSQARRTIDIARRSSKSQAPSSKEIPNPKLQKETAAPCIGFWDLGFGTWNF